jgi:Uma2 family endonuclease
VEVADTSLEFDRTRKAALYASAGIQEYWVLNLVDRRLEVSRHPEGKAYRTHVTYTAEDTVAPLAAPGSRLTIGSLLP